MNHIPITARERNTLSEAMRLRNKTTLELAKQIKYKRILELQTALHGSAVVKPRPKFRDFFAELASEKIRFDSNAGNWHRS